MPPGATTAAASRREKEQRPLRVVTDKNGRKVGIYGKPQEDVTDLHNKSVMKLAEDLAATGRYEYVTVNRGWKYSTDKGTSKRPDVIAVRRDGKVDAWEIESPTDNPYLLHDRVTGEDGMRSIPEGRRGIAGVYRPNGLVKDPKAINDMRMRGQDPNKPSVQPYDPN
jgi:hypothetical protein